MLQLAEHGTPRVHALVNGSDWRKIELLTELGFVVNDGEEAMLLQTPALLPHTLQQWQEDPRVYKMCLDDVGQVLHLLSSRSEVALCPWENEAFFKRTVGAKNSALYVTKEKDEVTGVLVGGSFLSYGSICHVAVAEKWRGQDLGLSLCKRAIRDFTNRGVKRVHLLVTAENRGVLRFWEGLGFVKASPQIVAMEIDC